MRAAWWLAMGFPVSAWAVPVQMVQQGRLIDASGAPVEGSKVVVVSLLGPTGTVLFDDVVTPTFQSGFYAVTLGANPADPLDAAVAAAAVSVSISVDGQAMGVQPLAAVPRATSLSDGAVVKLGEGSQVDNKPIATLPDVTAATSGLASQSSVDAIAAAVGTNGMTCGEGQYSRTCQDWSAKGWTSRAECLQDRRWHVVYAHSGSGTAQQVDGFTLNYAEAFGLIVDSGLDTKITLRTTRWDEQQTMYCHASGEYNNVMKCSSTNVALHCGFSDTCNEVHSLIEYASDGTLWAWESSAAANAQFNDSWSGANSPTTAWWWVRY